MKINSINSTQYFTKNVKFGHSAVPYPEYEYAYYGYKTEGSKNVSKLVNKFLGLFTPEVTNKSKKIKTEINQIYDNEKKAPFSGTNPQKQLLSVFA